MLVQSGEESQLQGQMKVRVVRGADSEVSVRVPHRVVVGDTVHLRTRDRIAVGQVRHCAAIEAEFEIRVLVTEIHSH
jgi:hypothetical protein